MIQRSLTLWTIALISIGTTYAQTPEAPPPIPETRVFSSVFGGDGGYLGIQTTDINQENFAKFGLREVRGVAVEKVIEDSPAAAAGLRNNDVIVRFNDEEVTSVRKLTRLIGEVAPDHQVRLGVVREGQERQITATLAKRPTPKFDNSSFAVTVPEGGFSVPNMRSLPRVESLPEIPDAPGAFAWTIGPRRRIGIGITPLTKQLAEHFGVSGGLMINNVSENSPALRAGLRAGDIIVEVDGKSIDGDGDIMRALAEKKEGDITLTIVRDRNRQTIRVTPEDIKGNMYDFSGKGEGPKVFKLTVPSTPKAPGAAPLRLNEFFMPNRIL